MWDSLNARQLIALTDVGKAKDLFKESVQMVEIEVFSYCNRRCWFCPNSTVDRISSNNYMNADTYSLVIDQLSEISYDGKVSYSRYNEPFADDIIFDRMAEAHQKLPYALLHTNSNGDYLTMEKLERAYQSGLRSLNIQFYLKNDERYDHEKTRFRAQQVMERLPLNYTLTRDDPGEWLGYSSSYKDMQINAYGRNFSNNGTNRGEQVEIHNDYSRTSPCLVPFWSIYIDYNGKTMPCCNVRSDIAGHEPYIMSDLERERNIFLNYANARLASFRRSMLGQNLKDGLCRSCHFLLEQVDDERDATMTRVCEEADVLQNA